MDVAIESSGLSDGGAYEGRAAAYDRLVGSRLYNRLAWGTEPTDYAAFARRAVTSGSGPLLDVAAGTATATADAYRITNRSIVLTDRSTDMLRVAAQRIAGEGELRPGVRFVQADAFHLPFEPGGFDTVLCLGFLHLVGDPAGFVAGLKAQVAPGGRAFISSLVAATGSATATCGCCTGWVRWPRPERRTSWPTCSAPRCCGTVRWRTSN